jgi:hypothetical protein
MMRGFSNLDPDKGALGRLDGVVLIGALFLYVDQSCHSGMKDVSLIDKGTLPSLSQFTGVSSFSLSFFLF